MKDFDVVEVRNECLYATVAVILTHIKMCSLFKLVSHGLPLGGEWRNSEITVKKAYE
jgi:hypothetical protein